jgi:hypothetical protein
MRFYKVPLFFLCFASSANADPKSGQAVNRDMNEHIAYECQTFIDGAIGCTFTLHKVEVKQNGECMVRVSEWKTNFRYESDNTWLMDNETGILEPLFPEKSKDNCGAIQLDRFEYDEEGKRYNLVRRSVPANPSGTVGASGALCSSVYTGEDLMYRWQDRSIDVTCNSIRFKVLN